MKNRTLWIILGGLLVLVIGAAIGFGLGMRFGVAQAAGINFSDPSTWPDANKDGRLEVDPGFMYGHMAQMHGYGGWFGGHMGGWGWFSPFGMMGGGGFGGLLTVILLGVIVYLLARRNNSPAAASPPAAPVETKKK